MLIREDLMNNSAVYSDTISRLRFNNPAMSDDEMHQRGIDAINSAVYGHDAKKDSRGRFIPQGIGAPGNESGNHFAAIKRWEGREAWEKAVRDCWKRNPEHAKKMNLPELSK